MTAEADASVGAGKRLTLVQMLTGRSARVFVIRSLGVAALFGLELTLARWLGVAGYGVFSFALTLAILVSRLAPLGWLNVSTRLLSAYASAGRTDLFNGSLILAYVATAAGLAVAVPILAIFSSAGETRDAALPFVCILALAGGLAIVELHRYLLRGLHAGELGEALAILLLPALVSAAVWVLALSDPATAGYAYAAVCGCLALGSAVMIARRLPTAAWRTRPSFRVREWLLAAFAVLMGSISTELTTRMSIMVLGTVGTHSDVGLYNAAARLAIMNVFVLRAITPVAAPRFSALYHSGRLVELRTMFRNLCAVSFAGALICFLPLWFFPTFVLGWFGAEFEAAAPVLRILSIGYLASAAAGPCATGLMMIGQERAYAGLALTTLLVSAIANYLLVQHYGAVGAATATAAAMVLNNAAYVAIFLRAVTPRRSA